MRCVGFALALLDDCLVLEQLNLKGISLILGSWSYGCILLLLSSLAEFAFGVRGKVTVIIVLLKE